jgi:trimethylamine:corrinoid methyltransferase-like protein
MDDLQTYSRWREMGQHEERERALKIIDEVAAEYNPVPAPIKEIRARINDEKSDKRRNEHVG